MSTLPLNDNRAGQFSTSIIDPVTRAAFPGNFIPDSRIDPVARRILGYLPLAQIDSATNNYVFNSPSNENDRSWNFRVDQVLSASQTFYVRASSQRTVLAPSSPLPADGQGNYVSGGDGQISDNKSAVFVHNAVWSPTMVSAVRLGWNRLAWDNIVPDQALRGVGIPGVDSSQPGFSSSRSAATARSERPTSPYEAIYTDPTVFTRPWTITIPNRRVTDNTPQDDSEQPDVPGGASRQRSHHRSVRAYLRGRQRRPRSSGR